MTCVRIKFEYLFSNCFQFITSTDIIVADSIRKRNVSVCVWHRIASIYECAFVAWRLFGRLHALLLFLSFSVVCYCLLVWYRCVWSTKRGSTAPSRRANCNCMCIVWWCNYYVRDACQFLFTTLWTVNIICRKLIKKKTRQCGIRSDLLMLVCRPTNE